MKSRLRSFMVPLLLGAIANRDMFEGGFLMKGRSFNPNYRVPTPKRELKEFNIKGCKIMAYSRKDAIKRLKHKKIRI